MNLNILNSLRGSLPNGQKAGACYIRSEFFCCGASFLLTKQYGVKPHWSPTCPSLLGMENPGWDRNLQLLLILAKCQVCLFLCLQDWGKPGDLRNLAIQWHVPSAEETAFAYDLLDSFLQPQLDKLDHYTDGNHEMSRSVVGQRVSLVSRGWKSGERKGSMCHKTPTFPF